MKKLSIIILRKYWLLILNQSRKNNMRTKIFLYVVMLLSVAACKKESFFETAASSTNAIRAAMSDTIKIPLIDMGTQTYMSYRGGLYPDGSNNASGQYAADLHAFAASIVPLDSLGRVNTRKGKIGFIGIGASTCAIMMNALTAKTVNNPLTNSYLKMATCTDGGASVNEIMNPADLYWQTENSKLKQSGLSAKQVQVIYMETDDSTRGTEFPGRPLLSKDFYAQAMRLFKVKFPNVKIVYLIGRTTTFIPPKPKGKNINSEPIPYYNGWACKFLIQDQINGAAGLVYKGANAVAPMVTWGWYEWADGTTIPRSDGFVWLASETKDGLHANDAGADVLSDYFQNFLLTDSTAKIWYAKKQ